MLLKSDEVTERLPPLDDEELRSLDAWWRACNYLTVGQIYLRANPLLRRSLSVDDIKPRLLGHWGTSPGLSFVYAHVSRLIRHTSQQALYLAGPGHGGPALVAAGWLEGTYSEIYSSVPRDEAGMTRLFRQFSSPGGVPSHVSVTTPGSIHEGGELGYVLLHAFGAVMDNPSLLAIAVVGDGEAETAPLEGSWKGISFLNPAHDGAVLPILHLNGAKISGPTVLGRKPPAEVRSLFEGHGYRVIEVEGDDIPGMHRRFAAAMAEAWFEIREIQRGARLGAAEPGRPSWPMIILRTPKGWTGPAAIDGIAVAGTFRAHQVPLRDVRDDPDHLAMLEAWLRSYGPEELFDPAGRPRDVVLAASPAGDLRLSATSHANGGSAPRDLDLPDYRRYAIEVDAPGRALAESTRPLGALLRDVYRRNPGRFRLFCPDETNSNRLGAVFEASDRAFMERTTRDDDAISAEGRVMEVLSEHSCHGWLEGYTLTGRYGLFATYEAFAMVSASQTIQHSKWLEESAHLTWRRPVPSLNILLTSTAWRNDHNGFSHQGPGLLQNVITQRGDVSRVYLPPDANCLLCRAGEASSPDAVALRLSPPRPPAWRQRNGDSRACRLLVWCARARTRVDRIDRRIGSWEVDRDAAAVGPLDEVRRGTVVAMDLEDLRIAVRLSKAMPVHDDAVADASLHGSSSYWVPSTIPSLGSDRQSPWSLKWVGGRQPGDHAMALSGRRSKRRSLALSGLDDSSAHGALAVRARDERSLTGGLSAVDPHRRGAYRQQQGKRPSGREGRSRHACSRHRRFGGRVDRRHS